MTFLEKLFLNSSWCDYFFWELDNPSCWSADDIIILLSMICIGFGIYGYILIRRIPK